MNNEEKLETMNIEDFNVDSIIDAINQNLGAKEIIQLELKSWGLDPESFTFKAFNTLSSIKPNNDIKKNGLPYSKAITEIAKKTKKPVLTINSVFSNAAKKLDFSNAKFIPVLKHMDREDITKEFLVKQLYDFVIGDFE